LAPQPRVAHTCALDVGMLEQTTPQITYTQILKYMGLCVDRVAEKDYSLYTPKPTQKFSLLRPVRATKIMRRGSNLFHDICVVEKERMQWYIKKCGPERESAVVLKTYPRHAPQ